LSSSGPLGTTVDDVALAFAALAGRPDFAKVEPPSHALRIAISTKPPPGAAKVDAAFDAAARQTGELLEKAGHQVVAADPPYDWRAIYAHGMRVASGIAFEAEGLRLLKLAPRTRPMVVIGKLVHRLGLVRESHRDTWRRAMRAFFESVDVLVTPTLAATPPPCEGWSHRGMIANARIASFAPFTAPWNLAGYPAASIPAGVHPDGMPLAVQIVAPDGGDALVLSVAKQLEGLRPWARHAAFASDG
jgi:amidase